MTLYRKVKVELLDSVDDQLIDAINSSVDTEVYLQIRMGTDRIIRHICSQVWNTYND